VAKRVTILFDAVSADTPDEADNARQVGQVGAALKRLGYELRELGVGPDLAALAAEEAGALGTVFNLIEGLGGAFYLYTAAAHLLEWRGVPFTGASGDQLLTLSNKLLMRRLLPAGARMPALFGEGGDGARFIVKSVREHSSLGIAADSVASPHRIAAVLADRTARFGGDWFAEAFIAGREFSVAGIARDDGPKLFPPTEIVFDAVPSNYPKILDYTSKWDVGSAEYARTPRRALDGGAEPALAARLLAESRALWQGLALRGYARFDFRLSQSGEIFLLDLNLNPCLSGDAGFAAAAREGGWSYDETIAAILRAARLPARAFPIVEGARAETFENCG
jgi:D-alanine-D-alanine ligase